MRFNLNKILPLTASLLGIIVPIFIWMLDSTPKSISVNVLSSTSIGFNENQIENINVTFKGTPIKNAFITTLEFKNNGSKPIKSMDFESDIIIKNKNNNIKIIEHKVDKKTPEDIDFKSRLIDNELRISPLLLNEGDTIFISLVTEGGKPEFTAWSRIAEINKINVSHNETKPNPGRGWLMISSGVLCAFLYMFNFMMSLKIRIFSFYGLIFLLSSFSAAMGSAVLLKQGLYNFRIEETYYSILPLVIIGCALAMPISRRFYRAHI